MARVVFIFVKQQTAYEMRISDWSSDVCSSDLGPVIVDAQHDRPPVLEVRHAYERRHLQGRMGGGQRILVVELTIRGQPRMKPRAIPGGDARLVISVVFLGIVPDAAHLVGFPYLVDRKSTRLNSSH